LLAVLAKQVPDSDTRGQEIIVLALLSAGVDSPLLERLVDSNSIDLRRVTAEYAAGILVGRLTDCCSASAEMTNSTSSNSAAFACLNPL
jgi:hypothetical protein